MDKIIEKIIEENGAISAEKNYPNPIEGLPPFPASACISVNEQVIHGVPSKKTILKDGDLVSIDLVILKDGYHVDAARTYGVGNISDQAKKLIDVARNSFKEGLKCARIGNRIGDISNAIQTYVEKNGFSVLREYQGHGIGKEMHEEPGIPNYGKKGVGLRLQKGMTIAIEPMVNEGTRHIEELDDGWTVITADHKLSAHYENTILITDKAPEILTN